jgi:hypothetical protein
MTASAIAGRPMAPEDGLMLLEAQKRFFGGEGLESALGFAPGWRVTWRVKELRQMSGPANGETIRAWSRRVHNDLASWAAKRKAGTRPGFDYERHLDRIIEANGGRIPSAETIRKSLSG